ncbi:vesicle transport v-SNARE 11-like isoform X2 [Triticum dicoccoides]|uniref:vesicle transport v-SNARE 11-like isoform X2 n=1 Tax=Triticum dicoccoides TaxID=85692 RepID=UPI00188E9B2C|nr:vesicle transport v-SNARE 11-like isoform X2 [Triticum dicoccoides]
MSEVFEGYERQYREISAALSRKCASASALDGEKKQQKLSEIQADVQESESLIRKMDLEARSLHATVRAGLLSKLRQYKSDLNNIKSETKKVSAPNAQQAAREELLNSGMPGTLGRGRLMMTSERLNQSSDRIRESQITALDTEEIGVSILQNLHNQRETLMRAHKTACFHMNSRPWESSKVRLYY